MGTGCNVLWRFGVGIASEKERLQFRHIPSVYKITPFVQRQIEQTMDGNFIAEPKEVRNPAVFTLI